MDTKEILSLVKSMKELGVSEFKAGDLEVRFNPSYTATIREQHEISPEELHRLAQEELDVLEGWSSS